MRGGANRFDIETFIQKARQIHGELYNYSLSSNYRNQKTKLIIICKIHGNFSQSAGSHLVGSGCPKCAKIKTANASKITREEAIERANKTHNNIYEYKNFIYTNCNSLSEITCKIHGAFYLKPAAHISGTGCPHCSKIQKDRKNSYTNEEFIQKAIEKHGSKYDYDRTKYIPGNNLVIIKCYVHGYFEQFAETHLMGCGCQKCSPTIKMTMEIFLERAHQMHGNEYNYSKFELVNANTKGTIICPKHGEFYQTAMNHLRGTKCAKCSKRKRTKKEFIERASKIHGDKYNYDLFEYISCMDVGIIICSKHGQFLQTPSAHLNGECGCQICGKSSSKPEKEWLDSFELPSLIRNKQIIIDGYRVRPDGFDPTTNMIYEFNGDYWHGNPNVFDQTKIHPIRKITYGELYKRTITKEEAYLSNGYTVVSIWESDFLAGKPPTITHPLFVQ